MKTYKNTNDERIAVLETNVGHTHETLSRIEKRFDNLDEKFNKIDEKFEMMNKKMDEGFKSVNSRLWTNFYWTLGAMCALAAVMAHGFKWF